MLHRVVRCSFYSISKTFFMTLAFSTAINGSLSFFVEKILNSLVNEELIKVSDYRNYCKEYDERHLITNYTLGNKNHTIRKDEHNRWRPGMLIHFAIGNRTKKRYQFAPVVKCVSTQTIQIKWIGTFINIGIDEKPYLTFNTAASWSMGLKNDYSKICELSKNDGFDNLQGFLNYFNTDFTGKLIHWTNLKY